MKNLLSKPGFGENEQEKCDDQISFGEVSCSNQTICLTKWVNLLPGTHPAMASSSDWRANPLYYGIRKVGTLFLQQPRKRGDVLPSYYCKIAGKLGETRYRKLCNDTRLVLEEIFICQEELELVGTCLRSIRRRLNPNHNETEEVSLVVLEFSFSECCNMSIT